MNHYRLYFMGEPEGGIERFEPIVAEGDIAAMEAAKAFQGRRRLELWWRGRKVGDLKQISQVTGVLDLR